MPKKMYVEDEDDSDVTCPVCGKPVGMEVTSCPHCGAEFEEEEIEEVEATPEEVVEEEVVEEAEEEQAECPVCGKPVGLTVASCPYCGAEFEEEEVEEIIEVEEQEEAIPVTPQNLSKVAFEVSDAIMEKFSGDPSTAPPPSRITDLRVVGFSLIVLGIIGSQIAFMIDWYWTWVPPIENNLLMFIAIPAAVIVIGLVVYLMIKRSMASGKKVPKVAPGTALSMFLFGILCLVLILLWDPINTALQDSNLGVGGAFIGIIIVGILAVFMGSRMIHKATA